MESEQDDVTGERHGKWGTMQPGQIEPGRTATGTYLTRVAAEEHAAHILPEYGPVEVRLCKTWEHDLPSDDPAYRPEQRFESRRWTAIHRAIERES